VVGPNSQPLIDRVANAIAAASDGFLAVREREAEGFRIMADGQRAVTVNAPASGTTSVVLTAAVANTVQQPNGANRQPLSNQRGTQWAWEFVNEHGQPVTPAGVSFEARTYPATAGTDIQDAPADANTTLVIAPGAAPGTGIGQNVFVRLTLRNAATMSGQPLAASNVINITIVPDGVFEGNRPGIELNGGDDTVVVAPGGGNAVITPAGVNGITIPADATVTWVLGHDDLTVAGNPDPIETTGAAPLTVAVAAGTAGNVGTVTASVVIDGVTYTQSIMVERGTPQPNGQISASVTAVTVDSAVGATATTVTITATFTNLSTGHTTLAAGVLTWTPANDAALPAGVTWGTETANVGAGTVTRVLNIAETAAGGPIVISASHPDGGPDGASIGTGNVTVTITQEN
jgi:hypothetical protein